MRRLLLDRVHFWRASVLALSILLVATSFPGSSSVSAVAVAPTTSAASGTVPVPANSGSGRRLIYANALQRVWAVNATGSVVRTFLVTGRSGVPNPGSYKVFSQSLLAYSSADPSVTMRFMTRFAFGPQGGNIGLHEIPRRKGIPLEPDVQLGGSVFVSGGCVRASTADAQFVYGWAPVGTRVVVVP